MEHKRCTAIIEGLLFLCGDEGIRIEQLIDTLELEREEVEARMSELMKNYCDDETRGMELVCFGGVYKLVSKAFVHDYAKVFFASIKAASLSNAAMETLAIIAYKQPITRVEIEEIRGVSCDMMIRKLLARNLIKECGRSDAPGRPFLYEVTSDFMDSFQLQSLKELPELPKVQNKPTEDLYDEEAA